MMPKIALRAPAQIDGGQIHASRSGKNYNLGPDRVVVVDSADVADLLAAGFQHVETDGSEASAAEVTTSVSPTSATEGAQALDPEARQANQRTEIVYSGEQGGNQGDFGNAVPPHGKPAVDPAALNVTAEDAKEEAETKAAAGSDPAVRSAQAETGAPAQQAGTAAQQAKAAEKVSGA